MQLWNPIELHSIEDNELSISREQRAELEALKTGAKDIKQRFEHGVEDDSDMAEEKRRQMQEEFERLKSKWTALSRIIQFNMFLENRRQSITIYCMTSYIHWKIS